MDQKEEKKKPIKDPMRYEKVQGGYENLTKVIFRTQISNLFKDLTEKMVELKN